MGRKRAVDRDALLDAAETVVRRDGAARITLDAVASEAGISKASVLYDCKSKDGLVQAIFERRVAQFGAQLENACAARADRPDAEIQAFVAAASEEVCPADREIMMALKAVHAQDPSGLDPLRELYADWIARIEDGSRCPRAAIVAFLATEGLRALEWFDVHRFAPEQRRRILQDIVWLTAQSPGAPAAAAADGGAPDGREPGDIE